MAVNIIVMVFWDVTPCTASEEHQCFENILLPSSGHTLKMEAAHSPQAQ
jgi:hypothetical protein